MLHNLFCARAAGAHTITIIVKKAVNISSRVGLAKANDFIIVLLLCRKVDLARPNCWVLKMRLRWPESSLRHDFCSSNAATTTAEGQ